MIQSFAVLRYINLVVVESALPRFSEQVYGKTMRTIIGLSIVWTLNAGSTAQADCGLNEYDVVNVFDVYARFPQYPVGFNPRHPLKDTFADSYIMNFPASIMYPSGLPFYPDLNDTIEAGIRFVNADTIPLVIKDLNVEAWIEPRVFKIGDNVEKATSLASPPSVKWRVRYWRMPNGVHTRPDTLFYKQDYIMKIDVWDVPEGKYQLAILGTDSVPSWFDVMPSSDFYHMLPANSLADSINAWATIFERVMADGDPSNALPWLDSIFTHNSKSAVGYFEQAMYHWEKNDSASVVEAFDAVLSRLESWDDPALPDTTDLSFNSMNLQWKHYMFETTTRKREIYINCPEWR